MACIYYHPEAYTTSGPKLMGRNAAGESFLRGYLVHSKSTQFAVQVEQSAYAQNFLETARTFGRNEAVQVIHSSTLEELAKAGLIYYPGPRIAKHAWSRSLYGDNLWSLCGITHTTSSVGAMDALVDLISAPIQPWDALICTSKAVKNQVLLLLQTHIDYLKNRLGISKLVLPEFPIIPLGIHTQDFSFSSEQRRVAREQMGVEKEALIVLYMGRLSFHAKAHPLAMYQALEAAATSTNKSVVLIECGWHANEQIARAYQDAANSTCPSVRVITLDGRNPIERDSAWACADIFCSLSDNIQETFGITPIEAMAAGLPVVVSDWDGYKDTVRDEIDGFRIPTHMPTAGLGGDLALRHALEIDTYDRYCGYTCSLVSVDIEAARDAFIALFDSAQLRVKMGQAGRERAVSTYDWKVIIPQYEALWDQLSAIRIAQGNPSVANTSPWPARMDPFKAFANYPSAQLKPETILSLVGDNPVTAMVRIESLLKLAAVNFAKFVLPSMQEFEVVLNSFSGHPRTAIEAVSGISENRRPFVFRSLAWLLKMGILRVDS